MINFAANLSMMFNESDFMKRFQLASQKGFKGVEYLFPYDYKKEDIKNELEKNNLPIELAILPYIESNYDPFSISSSGAVGIWQFMPRTGRLYELNKSWWYEDRHDPYKSTEAAVSYLKYLYKRFDKDIYLTIASYNAGPGNLKKWLKEINHQDDTLLFM